MKQVVFVKKNEAKWKAIERYNRGYISLTADELSKYYLDVTDELAYAKSFYPDSSLVDYLNELASALHRNVYKNKREDRKRIRNYWLTEIPLAISRHKKELWWSTFTFLIAVAIGLFSAFEDESFIRSILGDGYVNITIENIKSGDPMAIYKDESQTGMFIGIGTNNIRVSFMAFVLGIFSALFTGLLLFSNGIMVGAFIYFFVNYGLFWLSFTSIMIHGTLELSAIILAGFAGMILGNSWMFPGTYPRTVSLVKGAKDAAKIIISLIPVFIMAAFLEAYVTRHYLALGMIGRLSIMILSFAFIIWYYYYLPDKTNKLRIENQLAELSVVEKM